MSRSSRSSSITSTQPSVFSLSLREPRKGVQLSQDKELIKGSGLEFRVRDRMPPMICDACLTFAQWCENPHKTKESLIEELVTISSLKQDRKASLNGQTDDALLRSLKDQYEIYTRAYLRRLFKDLELYQQDSQRSPQGNLDECINKTQTDAAKRWSETAEGTVLWGESSKDLSGQDIKQRTKFKFNPTVNPEDVWGCSEKRKPNLLPPLADEAAANR